MAKTINLVELGMKTAGVSQGAQEISRSFDAVSGAVSKFTGQIRESKKVIAIIKEHGGAVKRLQAQYAQMQKTAHASLQEFGQFIKQRDVKTGKFKEDIFIVDPKRVAAKIAKEEAAETARIRREAFRKEFADRKKQSQRLLTEHKRFIDRYLQQERDRFNRLDSLRRRRIGLQTARDVGRTIAPDQLKDASVAQLRALASAHDRLALAAGRAGLSKQKLDAIIKKHGNNFTTLTRRTREAAIAYRQYQNTIASVGKKNAEVAGRMLLTWQNYFRYFITHATYQAVFKIVSAFKSGITEAIKYEVQLAEIKTLSLQNKDTTDDWAQSLRTLADRFSQTGAEIAEAAYQALSNQIVHTKEQFTSFAKDALTLALVTRTSAKEATDFISSIINAYGLAVSDSFEIAAKGFKTVELGRLRLEEIASTLGNILAPAAKLGISFEEINSALVVMTRQGIKANIAQTNLRGILLKLIRPSDKMKELFADLGVANAEAAFATHGFTGFLRILEERTKGSSSELGELFQRIRPITGAFLLLGKNLNLYNDTLREMHTKSLPDYLAAQEEVFQNAGKIIEIEMDRIKNHFVDTFGRDVVRMLADFSQAIGGVSNYVIALAEAMKVAAISSAALFAVWGIGGGAAIASSPIAKLLGFLGKIVAKSPLGATIVIGGTVIASILAASKIKRALAQKDLETELKENRERVLEFKQSLAEENQAFRRTIDERVQIALQGAAKITSIINKEVSVIDEQYRKIDKSLQKSISSFISALSKEISDVERLIKRLEKSIKDNTKFIANWTKDIRNEVSDFAAKLSTPEENKRTAAIRIRRLRRDAEKALKESTGKDLPEVMEKIRDAYEETKELVKKIFDIELAQIKAREKSLNKELKARQKVTQQLTQRLEEQGRLGRGEQASKTRESLRNAQRREEKTTKQIEATQKKGYQRNKDLIDRFNKSMLRETEDLVELSRIAQRRHESEIRLQNEYKAALNEAKKIISEENINLKAITKDLIKARESGDTERAEELQAKWNESAKNITDAASRFNLGTNTLDTSAALNTQFKQAERLAGNRDTLLKQLIKLQETQDNLINRRDSLKAWRKQAIEEFTSVKEETGRLDILTSAKALEPLFVRAQSLFGGVQATGNQRQFGELLTRTSSILRDILKQGDISFKDTPAGDILGAYISQIKKLGASPNIEDRLKAITDFTETLNIAAQFFNTGRLTDPIKQLEQSFINIKRLQEIQPTLVPLEERLNEVSKALNITFRDEILTKERLNKTTKLGIQILEDYTAAVAATRQTTARFSAQRPGTGGSPLGAFLGAQLPALVSFGDIVISGQGEEAARETADRVVTIVRDQLGKFTRASGLTALFAP